MRFLSKFTYLLLSFSFFTLLTIYYLLHTTVARAQVPGLLIPCDKTDDNEFHTLRPYQASPCSDGPKALFCSNKLIIFENFELTHRCQRYRKYTTGTVQCDPRYHVDAHNLNITLDDSELPIIGNTEDDFDDATKLNEYVSWYLSGIDSTGSTGKATNDQIVNYSGPLNKLLPQMISEAERKRTISRATVERAYSSEDDGGGQTEKISVETHDQYVVCGKGINIFGIDIGQITPVECYEGSEKIRISEWNKDLSIFNNLFGRLDAWNKRTPPLPWDDGTVENPSEENPPKPFGTQQDYIKAYKEWRGESCIKVPIINTLLCIDNPFVPNKWAELYPYIPLSSTTDVEGKNYLLTGDGPNYVPSQGTEIDNAGHKNFKNALLYLPHLQEVYDLTQLLNKTYTPEGHESEKLPKTTEEIKKGTSIKTENQLNQTVPDPKPNDQLASRDPYDQLHCSVANVRVNEGDNIFPGDKPDGKEIFVEGVEYDITNVECDEVYEEITCKDPNAIGPCYEDSFTCYAQVGIEFKTGTKTPYANEIFADTVADSGSTFRKIFPKVEKGAPVECIADIPTVSNVTYSIDNPLHESPPGGEQEFKQVIYPADGANSETQLTFPHIGSVYEYFLKGIQTALRPKGYGDPIANGNCKPREPVECGDWESKLEQSSGGSCGICSSELGDLAKRILATAGKAYNVPAANIWAAMKHEGGDWPEFQGKYTDENIRKWSTPVECGGEPMPSCDPNDLTSSQAYPPFGFLPYWFYKGDGTSATWAAVQIFDSTRTKETISHCNFLDAAFASAKSLATWSAFSRTPTSCYNRSMTNTSVPSCGNWSDDIIVQSHIGYWIGITSWCPDGTGGPSPLVNNIPIPDYANRVISDFNSAKCN